MDTNPLEQLKDIQLPDPIGFWPPAPGWFLLTLLILFSLIFCIIFLLKHKRNVFYKKIALAKLARLKKSFDIDKNNARHIQAISTLIRRAALSRFPREHVASLTGNAWLSFLDEHSDHNQFKQGPGKLLISAPYQAQASDQLDEIFLLVEEWIIKNV